MIDDYIKQKANINVNKILDIANGLTIAGELIGDANKTWF